MRKTSKSFKDLPDWTPSKTMDKTMRIYSARGKRPLSARKEKRMEVLITKQYDLTLPINNKKINKKVAYFNSDEWPHVFRAKSSHPKEMIIKTPVLEIKASERAKFAIKLMPVAKECEKKYVIFISRDKKEFENILLRVNYVSEVQNDQTELTYS